MLLSAPPLWAELRIFRWAGLLPGLTDSGQITPGANGLISEYRQCLLLTVRR